MRQALAVLGLLILMTGCGKKEQPAAERVPADVKATATTPMPSTSTDTAASAQTEPSLVSFPAGALIVKSSAEYGGGWTSLGMIDTYNGTGWASPENDLTPKSFVIELPEKTVLRRVEFDTGQADGSKRGVKNVSVEMSDSSAESGFATIATATLEDQKDNQSFPVSAEVPGRWVRLTLTGNQGATDYIELMDFRGYGKQLTTTPFPNVTGTYETDYGLFHLKQEGTSVTGCYEHDEGLLTGGVDGRAMNFTWRENGGPDDQGPALMVFSADGKKLVGLWGTKGDQVLKNTWNGKKVSNDVGSCPHWSSGGGAEERMKKELEELGRTRVYGINFDSDSDVIRAESKPTLDKIAALLKSQSGWTMTIEGHTDSSGGDAHNQDLSQRRAESVKQYLSGAGVAADRLTARGMGAGSPLAPNDTPIGRAQNRRVELVKG